MYYKKGVCHCALTVSKCMLCLLCVQKEVHKSLTVARELLFTCPSMFIFVLGQ